MNNAEVKTDQETRQDVSTYYGEVLQSKDDLATNACCDPGMMLPAWRKTLSEIHPEITDRFYGCGSPIPFAIEGKTVLDLGCGTGRDSFLISKLVGPHGKVIGVDMTEAQIAVANRHLEHQMQVFGYDKPNVEFRLGFIEDLAVLGIENESVDVVVSNCVINLSPEKEAVFREIFRVLKPGGELYFSDIFAGRRIPSELRRDPLLRGECLAGAMYIGDFRRMLANLGCLDYRIARSSPLEIFNPEVMERIGMVDFQNMTVRAFKLPMEDRCENYGQVAYYLGTVAECPHAFPLDDHHLFTTGLPVPICGNTADMLSKTRYATHFRTVGDSRVHYGLFHCAEPGASQSQEKPSLGCC